MKSIILLNHNENTKQVEAEEKSKFLKDLLEKMGIEISEFWDDDTILLSVDQKIKLRNILTTYAIKVIDDLDGHMQIFVEGELVVSVINYCLILILPILLKYVIIIVL